MVRLYRAAHLLVQAKARVPNDSYKLLLEQSGYKSRVDRPEPKMGTRVCGRTRGWPNLP